MIFQSSVNKPTQWYTILLPAPLIYNLFTLLINYVIARSIKKKNSFQEYNRVMHFLPFTPPLYKLLLQMIPVYSSQKTQNNKWTIKLYSLVTIDKYRLRRECDVPSVSHIKVARESMCSFPLTSNHPTSVCLLGKRRNKLKVKMVKRHNSLFCHINSLY